MPVTDFTGLILNKSNISDRIEELRLMVLGDNELKNFRTNDEYLLRFLHFRDFDINSAYKVMQEYTKLMLKYPKWYPSLSSIDQMFDEEIKTKAFLQGRDKCGRRIYVAELGKLDPNKSCPTQEACSDEIWFELIMDDPETQEKGVTVIIDVQGLSWKLIQWCTPSVAKISSAKADTYPCKPLVYHIVNNSTLVNAGVKLVWPFVSEKTKKNVTFHYENWSSLHEYISPDVLPPKYGGTGPDIDYDSLYEQLLVHKSAIIEKISLDQRNLQKLLVSQK